MAKTPKKKPSDPIENWNEIDLGRAAEEDRLAPAFQVGETLDQVAELLDSERVPVLTGEPGIGKTAVVYELARRAALGEGPAALRGRRLLQFSIQHLASISKAPHMTGQTMQSLVEALIERGEGVAPFFRDLHLAYTYDCESALNMLALRFRGPILAEGERSGVDRLLEYAPELQRYYTLVPMEEPGLGRAQRVLAEWAADQRARTDRRFDERAVETAIALTHRFLSRSRMPRKAIDLLSQVGGLVGPGRAVGEADVIARFCRSHSVPRVLVDPAVPLDLPALEETFRAQLLGQPEAVEAVVSMIGLVKAGLSDFRRPFGVFLFVGPTGVGKTHAAQLLAEYLFGGRERVIRVNMADHQGEHSADVLFGNASGGSRAEQRGVLTGKVIGQPFAVLLLDEFEKAHPRTHDRFMQLFDEGAFINAAGETIVCRSMIIIATSNAGAELYRSAAFGFAGRSGQRDRDAAVDRRLEEIFRFEFLNRFDRVVHFHPLSRADIRTIALRELALLRDRFGLRQRDLRLEVDESVIDWLAVHGYDPDNGARFLRRAIERHVATAVADAIVRDNPGPGRTVLVATRAGKPAARIVPLPAPSPARPGKAEVVVPGAAGERLTRLDAEELAERARAVAAAAAPLLAGLDERKAERSELVERMNDAGFWEDPERRRVVLDRFRELDVAVRTEDRLSGPLLRLRELLASGRPDADALARAFEAAARSLQEWDRRRAEEGTGAAWVLISGHDPLEPAGRWLADLTEMELAWCRRLHLTAEVVAYEPAPGGETSRVVIDVDGPGAAALLAMEAGLHRLRRPKGRDARARVDLVPKGPSPAAAWAGMRGVRPRTGAFGLEVQCQGRVGFDARGLSLSFLGAEPAVLSHFLTDLARCWAECVPAEPETARVYGEDGGRVRDPRTGTAGATLKDALRGRLDRFLEAWRADAAGPAEPAATSR